MSSYSVKLGTTADHLVDEMLEGMQATNPGASKVHADCQKLLVRTFQKSGSVSVVSGGRTGNEPFPSGFVGTGMLSAALYGENLNHPTADDISKSLEIVAGDTIGTDILVIVPKNLENLENFTVGAEKVTNKKIKVSCIFVGEERKEQNAHPCSSPLEDVLTSILIFKIAGAMAMEGTPLHSIISTTEEIIRLQATFEVNVASISWRENDNKDNEMDYPGNVMQICSLNDDILKKLQEVCSSLSLEQGNEVAAIVNIMDSKLQMVLWIFITRMEKELSKNGIKVVRIYSGNMINSDVNGRFQVCIVKLGKDDKEKEEWLSWLDAPTLAPSWPGGQQSIMIEVSSLPFENYIIKQNLKLMYENHSMKQKPKFNHHETQLIHSCIKNATLALIDAEDMLNAMEGRHESFKCGTIMKNIAKTILESLDDLPIECPADLLYCIANICETQDDDLGLVYAIFFTAAIPPLECVEEQEDNLQWAEAWERAFMSGIKGISRYYGPKQDRKTLVELLELVCTRYTSSSRNDFSEVISALNSCLPQINEYETINKSKKNYSKEYVLEKLGYDAEACGAEVCLKAIIKEISLHLSNFI